METRHEIIKSTGNCGYLAFYKDRIAEIYADSAYTAQVKAAEYFKEKKSYKVSVHLCTVDDKQITHTPVD